MLGLLKYRIARRLLAMLILLFTGFYLYCIAVLLLLRVANPPTTMLQVQRRVEALIQHRPYTKHYDFIPMTTIARNVQHAVVAAEDTRFYRHDGIDWEEIYTMFHQVLYQRGKLRGASTITQQLVKNLYFTSHRSLIRKLFELILAPTAERILSKRRILELYLNVVEWGPGIYGIQAAAEHYYGIPAAHLSRSQSARLAAILPAPLSRQPSQMDLYSREIQGRMRQFGW